MDPLATTLSQLLSPALKVCCNAAYSDAVSETHASVADNAVTAAAAAVAASAYRLIPWLPLLLMLLVLPLLLLLLPPGWRKVSPPDRSRQHAVMARVRPLLQVLAVLEPRALQQLQQQVRGAETTEHVLRYCSAA
jgi:hypothetical protein